MDNNFSGKRGGKMEKTALGRGLDSLIGKGRIETGAGGVGKVPVSRIAPNRYQPRREFAPGALAELKESIRAKGILQPLLVARTEEGYQLIAGERRLRAARELGMEEVPVLIRELRENENLLELALVENLQRDDLNPIETAESYQRLITEFAQTQEEVARKVGKSRPLIANTLRLLELDSDIKELVRSGALGFAQARTLLGVVDPKFRLQLARRVVAEGISVRTLEKLVVAGRKTPARKSGPIIHSDPHLEAAESKFREILKTKVSFRPGPGGGGKIEIEYYSPEDLERICGLLVHD